MGGGRRGGLNYTLEKISFLKNNKEERANTLKEKGGKRGEGGRDEGKRERNREGETEREGGEREKKKKKAGEQRGKEEK